MFKKMLKSSAIKKITDYAMRGGRRRLAVVVAALAIGVLFLSGVVGWSRALLLCTYSGGSMRYCGQPQSEGFGHIDYVVWSLLFKYKRGGMYASLDDFDQMRWEVQGGIMPKGYGYSVWVINRWGYVITFYPEVGWAT